MIMVETTAEVITTCYLTDSDEEKVKNYMEENCCDLEDDCVDIYEELYECKCGCRYVALMARDYPIKDVQVHRIEW